MTKNWFLSLLAASIGAMTSAGERFRQVRKQSTRRPEFLPLTPVVASMEPAGCPLYGNGQWSFINNTWTWCPPVAVAYAPPVGQAALSGYYGMGTIAPPNTIAVARPAAVCVCAVLRLAADRIPNAVRLRFVQLALSVCSLRLAVHLRHAGSIRSAGHPARVRLRNALRIRNSRLVRTPMVTERRTPTAAATAPRTVTARPSRTVRPMERPRHPERLRSSVRLLDRPAVWLRLRHTLRLRLRFAVWSASPYGYGSPYGGSPYGNVGYSPYGSGYGYGSPYGYARP